VSQSEFVSAAGEDGEAASGEKARGAPEGNCATGGAELIALLQDPELGAEQTAFAARATIFSDGTPAKHLFLIRSGQVRLYQTGPTNLVRLVDVMGADEWFGVDAIAGSLSYGVRAEAVVASTVWRIGIEPLLEVLRSKPDALAALNRDLARGLVEAREEASRLIFEDCNQRLISALIRLSDSAASAPWRGEERDGGKGGNSDEGDDGVVLHMTHSELAQTVGAARETVSLGLTELRNRNLLRTGRNRLFFNPEKLRRIRRYV
jgi:CRP/FNR family transcriptional regulator